MTYINIQAWQRMHTYIFELDIIGDWRLPTDGSVEKARFGILDDLIALEGAEDTLVGVSLDSRHCQREVAVERVI